MYINRFQHELSTRLYQQSSKCYLLDYIERGTLITTPSMSFFILFHILPSFFHALVHSTNFFFRVYLRMFMQKRWIMLLLGFVGRSSILILELNFVCIKMEVNIVICRWLDDFEMQMTWLVKFFVIEKIWNVNSFCQHFQLFFCFKNWNFVARNFTTIYNFQ